MNVETYKFSFSFNQIVPVRYRLAVLRVLPQLQKLDNIQVTPEELREAQKKGRILVHPEDPQESEEEEYIPPSQQQYSRYPNVEYGGEQEYSPQRSPSRQEVRKIHIV